MRLSGGEEGEGAGREGRVEVCVNNAWSTVCGEGWDDQDAAVVCRQLGFPPHLAAAHNSSFDIEDDSLLLTSVNCTGVEEELLDCEFDVPSYYYYPCFSLAGVVCSEQGK